MGEVILNNVAEFGRVRETGPYQTANFFIGVEDCTAFNSLGGLPVAVIDPNILIAASPNMGTYNNIYDRISWQSVISNGPFSSVFVQAQMVENGGSFTTTGMMVRSFDYNYAYLLRQMINNKKFRVTKFSISAWDSFPDFTTGYFPSIHYKGDIFSVITRFDVNSMGMGGPVKNSISSSVFDVPTYKKDARQKINRSRQTMYLNTDLILGFNNVFYANVIGDANLGVTKLTLQFSVTFAEVETEKQN